MKQFYPSEVNLEPSIANLAEVQSNSGDESLADLDSTSCGYTSDVAGQSFMKVLFHKI